MAKQSFPGVTVQVDISGNELQLFHSIDRRLYTMLAIELSRDPVESLLVMALWLSLERVGFYNLIQKILTFPAILISELADEALICLNVIKDPLPLLSFEAMDIPLTQNLIMQEISLQYFQDNKNLVRIGVESVHEKICVKAFGDIREDVVSRNETLKKIALENQQMILQQPQLRLNGFTTRQLNNNGVVPGEERTMFVTFSKGYPVAEWEVREFFTKMFGNCIESFYMQKVRAGDEHDLFARIVFFRPDIINMILSGMPKAKFTINGKHIWMLKYEPKCPKIMPMQHPHTLTILVLPKLWLMSS